MDAKKVIREFYRCFEKMDLEELLPLFASNATIESPVLGKQNPRSFYQELFSKTKRFNATLKDVYVNPDKPNRSAAFVSFTWEPEFGSPMTFEGVTLFELNSQGKIQMVHIIYDAQRARDSLRKAG